MQIRCNFPDISNLSETQKNNFQFLIFFFHTVSCHPKRWPELIIGTRVILPLKIVLKH